jgi:Flp pilus assembly protein TadD
MHHPINRIRCIACTLAAFAVAGCGQSQAEKAAKENERQRLELEKQAAREQQQGNEAIADIEKKIGRKPKPLDLNLPAEKKTDAAPAAPPKQ